jgi:hypothetical protein
LGSSAACGSSAKPAHDEQVEPDAAHCFLGGFLYEVRPHGAVLGTDGDGDALRLAVGSLKFARGLNPLARVGFEAVEDEPFLFDGVLAARLA